MKQTKKPFKPTVTVLIPVYNGAPFLEETVKSVFASTTLPIEVILVDDGSTDGSKLKCHALEKRFKHLHFYDFAQNRGMTRCLNFGIAKARGTFIARINQDDIMVKGRLDKQVTFLESHPEHVAVGSFVELFANDKAHYDSIEFPTNDEELKQVWMTLSPFADPSVMYRRKSILQTKGYKQSMWPADDVHMWYQLGMIGKLANIPEYLTRVRWHQGAGSIKSHKLQMEKTWKVHQWAANNIRKPSIGEYVFWVGEHMAGRLFPPQVNWYVYRLLRKLWKKRSISLKLWQLWEDASLAFSWTKR